MKEGNELSELLSSFSCEKDGDIEFFLHNKAIEFEKLSKTRTYLILNQEVSIPAPIEPPVRSLRATIPAA